MGKTYSFTETEKDSWANLFEYKGSDENVRLKFAVDRIGATLNDIVIVYEDSLNGEAWERFISSLKRKEEEKSREAEPDQPVSEEPEVAVPPVERRRILLSGRYRWAALWVQSWSFLERSHLRSGESIQNLIRMMLLPLRRWHSPCPMCPLSPCFRL